MSSKTVLGLMWGDEAKAKIVDVLAESADVVARFQGGNNAGHTIYLSSGEKFVFHSIPCGVLYPDKILILGSGVVINLSELLKEMNELESKGYVVLSRLKIYGTATLILPIMIELDKAREKHFSGSNKKIGTTQKGIGPSYERRAVRDAIRFIDIFSTPEVLMYKLKALVCEINILLSEYGMNEFSSEQIDDMFRELMSLQEIFQYCLVDDDYIYNLQKQGKSILYEGAQGFYLDPWHGTYPYVTSNSTTVGSILTSSGIGIKDAPSVVVGVTKAYCTRVGEGPFPTEIHDSLGEKIREIGHEYGATTKRPRRVGHLDLVLLKRSAQLNGVSELALTCVDVLIEIGKAFLCFDYENANDIKVLVAELDKAKPIYEEFDLSDCSMEDVTQWNQIPEKVKEFISAIEEYVNVPITMLSFGPRRDQIVFRQ